MRIRLAVCLFLGLASASCNKTEPSVSAPTESIWKEFTSTSDGFAISMPTMPDLTSQDNQYDFGKVVIRSYMSNPRRNVAWQVATHNYPDEFASQITSEVLIELMRNGMAENIKGKVEGVKEVSLDGHTGQEFLVQAHEPISNKPSTCKVRLFKVGSRVY